MMKALLISGIIGLGMVGAQRSQVAPQHPDKDSTAIAQPLERSRAAANDLMKSLRDILVRQLEIGKTAGAMSVCADSAQRFTESIVTRHHVSLRRVALRWRNKRNAPDAYETKTLRRFEALRKRKKLDSNAEHYEIVREGKNKVFRYMRPILMQGICLSCHGAAERLNPEVKKIIKERYPDDKAVNFNGGDVRGAFSVRVPIGR